MEMAAGGHRNFEMKWAGPDGVVTGLTGPYANLGQAQANGANLAIKQLGGKAGSHPISVVVRDEEWLVRSTQHTPADGAVLLSCRILSRPSATFFTLAVHEAATPAAAGRATLPGGQGDVSIARTPASLSGLATR